MQNIWKDFLKRKELAALIIVVSAMIFNSLGMQQGGMEIVTHYTEFGIIAGIIVVLVGIAAGRLFKSTQYSKTDLERLNTDMKIKWLRLRKDRWYSDYRAGETLALVGFALLLSVSVWSTTMFPRSGVIVKVCKLTFLGCMGVKFLLYDKYRIKELLLIALAGACVLGNLYASRYLDPLMWMMLILGSRNVPFKKIIQVYLMIAGGICLLAFAGSMLGIIDNLQYEAGERGIRNSFGIMYPTDFGAHVFFLLLSFFYLWGERLKWYHYMLGALAGFFVYQYCNARVDSGCVIMASLLFGIGNMITNRKNEKEEHLLQKIWKKCWGWFGPYIMPLLAIASITATNAYNWEQVGESTYSTLIARLMLGKKAFVEYGIKLFGQKIEMIGGGLTTDWQGDYFFLDCSYVNILMTWGVLLLIIVLGLFWYACWKNSKDLYLQYAIALIAVNCVIAHRLMDISYDIFVLAAVGMEQRKNCIEQNKDH